MKKILIVLIVVMAALAVGCKAKAEDTKSEDATTQVGVDAVEDADVTAGPDAPSVPDATDLPDAVTLAADVTGA